MTASATATATECRARSNHLRAAGAKIDPCHVAVLRLGIENVRIGRICLSIEAIATADAEPIGISNARIAACLAGPCPRAVILQAAVNVIRFAHVCRDRIKLRGHNRVDEFPGVTLVITHVQAAIISNAQVFAVLRIDPDRVMIAVRDSRLQRFESLAAIH